MAKHQVTHPVQSLSDEEVVSEAFEEGKWLVDGISDLQLLLYKMLKKSLFQGPGHGVDSEQLVQPTSGDKHWLIMGPNF